MDRINSQTGDHEQQNTVKNTRRVEKTPDLQAQRIVLGSNTWEILLKAFVE